MKKSEIYRLAQIAVIIDPTINPYVKPDILRVLIQDENVALFTESKEESNEGV